MYRNLGKVTLRSGEEVEAAEITAPDETWNGRVEKMLVHKGDPWNWQNHELLHPPGQPGLKARFFVLHRDAVPFANIMLVESSGIALLGHVWTEPEERGKGASSVLMEFLLGEFRGRGSAIFLGTDFGGATWKYYQRRGFEPVYPGSGYMALLATSPAECQRMWFACRSAQLEPLDWKHWTAAAPLLLHEAGGTVRIAATEGFGRISSEGPLLPLLREQTRRRATAAESCATVLCGENSAIVLGLASRLSHPMWPNFDLIDLHCHPDWWHRSAELLSSLAASRAKPAVLYCDETQREKRIAVQEAGFQEIAVLPDWLTEPGGSRISVTVFREVVRTTSS